MLVEDAGCCAQMRPARSASAPRNTITRDTDIKSSPLIFSLHFQALITKLRILEVAVVLTHVLLDLVRRPTLVHPRPGPRLRQDLGIVDRHLIFQNLVVDETQSLSDAHLR